MFKSLTGSLILITLALWPATTGSNPFVEKKVEIKKSSFDLPEKSETFKSIRILLLKSVKTAPVKTASPYKIFDKDGHTLVSGDVLALAHITSAENGIKIGSQLYRDFPITIKAEGDGVFVKDRFYRDAIVITKERNGKLTIINSLSIEHYLKGVLPWEANPKWKMEALKAQAITARTYALFKMIENQNEAYDLTKDVLSQVYAGKSAENPVTDEAVISTEGQILVYRGKIFPAYFHSTCGGATTSADTVWDIEPHPALKGAQCNFCKSSKHYKWSAEFSRGEIESKLRKNGYSVTNLKSIEVASRDPFGRATKISYEDDDGKKTIRANDFRLALDPGKLKSMKLDEIDHRENQYVFRGHGWGHGAGLCQYGMKELAELGYSHQEILKYYYPDTDVITWWTNEMATP